MKKITVLMLMILTILSSCNIERKYYDVKNVETVRTYEGTTTIPMPFGVKITKQIFTVYNITLDNDSIVELTYKGENMKLSKDHKIEIRNGNFNDPTIVYVINL